MNIAPEFQHLFRDSVQLTQVVVDDSISLQWLEALQAISEISIVKFEGATDICGARNVSALFVTDDFDQSRIHQLWKSFEYIASTNIVQWMLSTVKCLLAPMRPLYSFKLSSAVLIYYGLSREQGERFAHCLCSLGGRVYNSKTESFTHIVSARSDHHSCIPHYDCGTPIQALEWVWAAWDNRDDPSYNPMNAENLSRHRLKPFSGLKVSFCDVGSNEEEISKVEEMKKVVVANGGSILDDPAGASYVVQCEGGLSDITHSPTPWWNRTRGKIMKPAWIWSCISRGYFDCSDEFMIGKGGAAPRLSRSVRLTPNSPLLSTSINQTPGSVAGPGSAASSNPGTGDSIASRHRRLRVSLESLAHGGQSTLPVSSRLESMAEEGQFISPKCPDTGESQKALSGRRSREGNRRVSTSGGKRLSGAGLRRSITGKQFSKRWHVANELLSTETHYVAILRTILTDFRDRILSNKNDPILPHQDVRNIFGPLEPILALHEKILQEIEHVVRNWSEDALIGKIWLSHADQLAKCYPPYVSFLDEVKAAIDKFERECPRFEALLKMGVSLEQCRRQKLTDLMVVPVQRLPSTLLLLSQLAKSTSESTPDHSCLNQAHRAIAEVLANINTRKRKADGCIVIFKLLHQIENCPPILLNANRELVATFDNLSAIPNLCWMDVKHRFSVVIYLMSDCIEICKRKRSGSLLSPLVSKRPRTTTVTLGGSMAVPESPAKGSTVFHHQQGTASANRTGSYDLKHIEFIPLDLIQRAVDITDAPGEVFGLVSVDSGSNHRSVHTLYTFEASDASAKRTILQTIANQMSKCARPFHDLIGYSTTYELGMNGPLSVSSATATSGVTKTPSMKKRGGDFVRRMSRIVTQTPSRLTRGMSSILSPAVRQFTSSSAMTPAGDLANYSPSKNSLADESFTIPNKENKTSKTVSTSAIICPTPHHHLHGAFDGGIGASSLAEIEDENSNSNQ